MWRCSLQISLDQAMVGSLCEVLLRSIACTAKLYSREEKTEVLVAPLQDRCG